MGIDMQPKSILLPVCAQALLTFAVWLYMYITRIGTLKRDQIDPQELADEARALAILKAVVNPSDNLENLFELPVLFYTAIVLIFIAGLTDQTYLWAAWAFVAFRALHSVIHCTYNRIMHRFTAYLLSSVVLWGIWIRLFTQLLEPLK